MPGVTAPLDVVELTRHLVEIPSITNEEGLVCAFVERALGERGWRLATQPVPPDAGVDQAPGRMNVLATATEARPRVVLTTHLDTVPPHISFSEDDAWLYGRGTCDAKGVFAAMWVAAERLRDAGHPVGLLGVVGEETDSLGAKMVHELLPETDWIIDGEPTDGVMASGAKGILSLRLHVEGVPAHSAYPERGDSALHRLIPALATLIDADLPSEASYGPTTVNVGRVRGGVAPNVLAPSASADVMIRLGAPADRVASIVRTMLPPEVKIEELSRSDPHPIDVVDGQPSAVVRFGSDVPYLRRIGRPLLLGPGSIHDAHTRHERIRRQDLRTAVEQYVVVAEALLQRDPGR
jgi:acetylornithine deacetylase